MINKNREVVGHIPKALPAKLNPLLKSWTVWKITAVITGQQQRAPKGAWVLGGGIELPCTYFTVTFEADWDEHSSNF